MASTNKVPYRPSPQGVAVYPWINKPDTKYHTAGLYKVDLRMEGEAAKKFKAAIDAMVDEAFEQEMQELPAKDRKAWAKYVPYEEVTDDAGNPTGAILFQFRQNASIRVEGVDKEIKIAIYDATGKKEIDKPIYKDSVIRVSFKPRNIKIVGSKKAGVRLDFLKVQVITLAERPKQEAFDAVEGGYEAGEDYTRTATKKVEDPADDEIPF